MRTILFAALVLMTASGACRAATPAENWAELRAMPEPQKAQHLSGLLGEHLVADKTEVLTYWTPSRSAGRPGLCEAERVHFDMGFAPRDPRLERLVADTVYSRKPTDNCADFHPENHDAGFQAEVEWVGEYAPAIFKRYIDLVKAGKGFAQACTWGDDKPCTQSNLDRAMKADFVKVDDCGYDDRSPANRCLLYHLSNDGRFGTGLDPNSVLQIYYDTNKTPVHAVLVLYGNMRPWP